MADYLRSKGFRVVKPLKNLKDEEVVKYLQSLGYEIDGFLNGAFYSSDLRGCSRAALDDDAVQGSPTFKTSSTQELNISDRE
ncbi:MAG TPA: hypothetical protein VEI46_05555 [Thermodesulfovibrionales bacterium]|nr:hypothetical protein [Thermodesulfovibrionales bacterium]